MLIMGHRGARYEAPENTVAGFDHAVRLGLQAVEFDVRLTSDNQVAVIHDSTVDRTTDGEGLVAELTLAELKDLDARSIFPDWPTDCWIPSLAEVLEVIGGLQTFEIEIKHDEPERLDVLVPLVLSELERRSLDQAVFTSFDPYALALVGRLAPDRPRGWIADFDSLDSLDLALELGVQRVGVPVETGSAEIVAAARGKGLTVVGWPTNTRAEFDENVRRNVDVVCTDSPSTIRTWLPQLPR
jgi:glycerophosphoryl diester phosphodiesterase